MADILPEGFFDDPKQDAKVRPRKKVSFILFLVVCKSYFDYEIVILLLKVSDRDLK